MKKLFVSAFIIGIIAMFQIARADTLSVTNLITYQSFSGLHTTNNSPPVLIGTCYIPAPPGFSIQNGGLTIGSGTNSLTGYVQIGTDTNYFATIITYNPSTTNATEDVIQPGTLTVKIYAQLQLVTTTNLSAGGKAIFNR